MCNISYILCERILFTILTDIGVMMREGWMTFVLISTERVVHWLNIEIFSALFTLHNLKIVNCRNLLYNRISCVPLFSGYAVAFYDVYFENVYFRSPE